MSKKNPQANVRPGPRIARHARQDGEITKAVAMRLASKAEKGEGGSKAETDHDQKRKRTHVSVRPNQLLFKPLSNKKYSAHAKRWQRGPGEPRTLADVFG